MLRGTKARGKWRRFIHKPLTYGYKKRVKHKITKRCSKCKLVPFCLDGKWPNVVYRCSRCNRRQVHSPSVGWVVDVQRCPDSKVTLTRYCRFCNGKGFQVI